MKTLVLGGSLNPQRYSFKAINALRQHKMETFSIGLKAGTVADVAIITEKKNFKEIDTITLYLGPQHQAEYVNYIISLKPRRVIFNPGTENAAFEKQLSDNGIIAQRACTLVLLATGQY